MNERAFRCYGRSTCSSALEKEAAVNAAYEMQLVSGVVQGSGLGPLLFPPPCVYSLNDLMFVVQGV